MKSNERLQGRHDDVRMTWAAVKQHSQSRQATKPKWQVRNGWNPVKIATPGTTAGVVGILLDLSTRYYVNLILCENGPGVPVFGHRAFLNCGQFYVEGALAVHYYNTSESHTMIPHYCPGNWFAILNPLFTMIPHLKKKHVF